jgi:hypothetical protein
MADYSHLTNRSLTLREARQGMSKLDIICGIIETDLSINLSAEFQRRLLKEAGQFMEYDRQEEHLSRESDNDRVFRLETVELQHFRTEAGYDVEDVMIHTGPYADEYTRSLHALAITIGTDIFFRSNAFDTGSEEGRKTLTHELTHVAQHEEGKIDRGCSIEELEAEAEAVEKESVYDPDPYISLKIRNKYYKIRRSKMKKLVSDTATEIEKRIEKQKNILSEEQYLKVLVEYERWLKGIGHGD